MSVPASHAFTLLHSASEIDVISPLPSGLTLPSLVSPHSIDTDPAIVLESSSLIPPTLFDFIATLSFTALPFISHTLPLYSANAVPQDQALAISTVTSAIVNFLHMGILRPCLRGPESRVRVKLFCRAGPHAAIHGSAGYIRFSRLRLASRPAVGNQ